MPKGRPRPPERSDLRKLLSELYESHVAADDPNLVLWPDDKDALGILAYARRHHRALPPPTYEQRRRGDQAGLRLTIVRQLRLLLDEEELEAIDDARAGGLQWSAIAHFLGMEYPGSAANRRERLKAGIERPDGRRTPEAGRRLAKEQLVELERQRRAARTVASKFDDLKAIGAGLLRHEADLVVNEDAEEWMNGIREILQASNPSPTQQQGLSAYIGLAAADIRAHAREMKVDAARTPEAAAALERAHSV